MHSYKSSSHVTLICQSTSPAGRLTNILVHGNVIHSHNDIPTAVFKMQNSTGGVNQKCIEAYSPTNETWKCLSIPYAEPFTSTRLFALNSIYDSWQLANILQIPCKPPDCDSRYMEAVENYGKVRFSVYSNDCILPSKIFFFLVQYSLHLRIKFCLCIRKI